MGSAQNTLLSNLREDTPTTSGHKTVQFHNPTPFSTDCACNACPACTMQLGYFTRLHSGYLFVQTYSRTSRLPLSAWSLSLETVFLKSHIT